jgi:hypothetical protein
MHSVLVVIEEPKRNGQDSETKKWETYLAEVQNVEVQHPHIKRLSKGVFLIPLERGLSPLTTILAAAKNQAKHQLLFFEDAPDWVYSVDDKGDTISAARDR